MLPYGVGADSISARAIWGNAKPHGRALLAPTMHFFDSLGSPSRGAQRCVHPLAPSARGLRPQAVGERTVRLSEIFRAMARFSPSAPSGHRSPSGASATSPVSGESVSQREAFRHAGLPFEGSSRAAGEGWPDATPTPKKKSHYSAPPKAPLRGELSPKVTEGWPGGTPPPKKEKPL